jgi:hypothetical protein
LSTSLESLTSLFSGSSGSGLTDPLADLSALVSDPGSLIIDFANTLSTVASTDYGALLPTADIASALVTSVPAYDVSLFLDGLEAGNLLDAVGYPIAADVALVPLIAEFDYGVIADAVSTTLSALIP